MSDTVEQHYSSDGLIERILAALEESGFDTHALTPEILAPIDQFHTGGLPATRKLAAMNEITPGMELLDIGSGVGGAARYLAATYGCRTTGIDLTEAFCRAATVNGGAKLVHPGGAKLVHLTLCGTRCWGVVPVVHRRDPRCFV